MFCFTNAEVLERTVLHTRIHANDFSDSSYSFTTFISERTVSVVHIHGLHESRSHKETYQEVTRRT